MLHHEVSETFASFYEDKSQSRRGNEGNRSRPSSRKLQIRPYFGHYSGMWVTFVRSSSNSSVGGSKVRVKIEGSSKSSYSLHLCYDRHSLELAQSAMQTALMDMCLKFVHGLEPPTMVLNRNPSSLSFLCEKTILLNLNELDTSVLPSISFSHLNPNSTCMQDAFVKVWSGLSSCPTTMVRIKVKKGMLVAEFQWMIWNRLQTLSQFDLPSLELYEYSSTEKLSENTYLKPNQVAFHCILASSIDRDSIVVSLVGQGIEQIKVKPSMTLEQLQDEVKKKFILDSSSYLYFPSICQNKNAANSNCVAMSTVLDGSTLPLIDSKQRCLPLIDGIPLNLLKYSKIAMYTLTISDLGLLSSNLVRAYEVAGPTIPILFRAATDVGKSEFVLISERLNAISINLQWTVLTFLKYLEDVSHFPCVNITYKGSILQQTELLDRYFHEQVWQTKRNCSKIEFLNDVPKVNNL